MGETRYLTPAEIEQVERMAGLGLSIEMIASIVGVSKASFERRERDQPDLRDAVLKGRARAAQTVLQTLFDMATSGKHPVMTIFYAKCRLGWKEPREESEDDGREAKPVPLAYVPKSQRGK